MRRVAIVLMVSAVMVGVASADATFLQGVYYEQGVGSLAGAVRIDIPQLPDKLEVLGMYVVAPVVSYDGQDWSLALDKILPRIGPGIKIGSGAAEMHLAICWRADISRESLLNPGIFLSKTW